MRFSVISVDMNEDYLRSVKPFRFRLAQVLQSSISSLKEGSRKDSASGREKDVASEDMDVL